MLYSQMKTNARRPLIMVYFDLGGERKFKANEEGES